jgi:hypothetical protein
MALNQEEKEQFGISIVHQLSQTPYACPSLEILSGGTANFLFRGVLVQPLPDGTRTIVVKHSRDFVSANRNFKLDISFLSMVMRLVGRQSERKYADVG